MYSALDSSSSVNLSHITIRSPVLASISSLLCRIAHSALHMSSAKSDVIRLEQSICSVIPQYPEQ